MVDRTFIRGVMVGFGIGVAVPVAFAQTDATRIESEALFKQIATVLTHPRCLNCHTVTDFPRQGDDRHRHRQQVMRGADNNGFVTLRCASCHQTTNVAGGAVPGAPNWHLAPLSMGWEGLTDGQLCRALKDRRKNHEMSLEKLVQHMTEDKLVQWAWDAGGRAPPPIGQAEFHRIVKRWAETGAACPM
jgi:hypothetical protein